MRAVLELLVVKTEVLTLHIGARRPTVPHYMKQNSSCVSPPLSLLSFCYNNQKEKVISEYDIDAVRTTYRTHLESELAKISLYKPSASMLEGQWARMLWPASSKALRDPERGLRGMC